MFAVPGIPRSTDNSRVVADVAPHFCSAYSTAQAIRAELCRFRAAEKPDILVISKRPEYFDVSDLFDHKANVGSVRFVTSVDDLYHIANPFALAIVFQHAWEEYEFTFHLRAKGLAPLVALWTFDNHHQHYRNVCANPLGDVIFPSHAWCAGTLASPYQLLADHLPLCSAQWSRQFLAQRLSSHLLGQRGDELSGGFMMWGSERDALLREVASAFPRNALRLMGPKDRSYFALSANERLETWTRYKVALCLPLKNDVSLRLFDSLITGQIPIVPFNMPDLDKVISPDLQQQLPIIRFRDLTVHAIKAAWLQALERFNPTAWKGCCAGTGSRLRIITSVPA
jgi:hypothetical protein